MVKILTKNLLFFTFWLKMNFFLLVFSLTKDYQHRPKFKDLLQNDAFIANYRSVPLTEVGQFVSEVLKGQDETLKELAEYIGQSGLTLKTPDGSPAKSANSANSSVDGEPSAQNTPPAAQMTAPMAPPPPPVNK